MKRISLILICSLSILYSCNQGKQDTQDKANEQDSTNTENTDNPFFVEFTTPFGAPDFENIKTEHFMPAFKKGIEEQKMAIEAIVNSTEEPTFENTIVAMENNGEILGRVSMVFFNLNSAETTDEIQKLAQEITPLLSKHGDEVALNEKLFAKVKAVYDKKADLKLTTEQAVLLDETYKGFVRGGANLTGEKKEEFKKVNQELSMLSLKFGQNLLAETNDFQLVIDKEEDLDGLTEDIKAAALETGNETENKGKWVFTLQRPSIYPFLTYSNKRELREKIFKGYINRGNNDNAQDNKEILAKIASLRVTRANLLGYKSHAAFILEENMAENSDNVYKLLNQLINAALPIAKEEVKELQKVMDKENPGQKIEAWDWRYYAEKVRQEKYDLSEEALRPYFELENSLNGMFQVADKLWGLKFTERKDIPVYHKDVRVFEVKEADGSSIGLLYMDFFPRAGKRGGAWMTSFRKQHIKDGKNVKPLISTVFNFTKPTGDKPALLSFDHVTTLYHEFGHALHGLLSKCTYNSLSGTSVARDFVELPSQIMENWAGEKEVLKMYAKHYKTGEIIPDELMEKMEKSGNFNQGFTTVEYLAAAFLDMKWHTMTEAKEEKVIEFEKAALDEINLIKEIVVRYRSTYFSHIFSGGYSSGYYSYIWAEILDADAFNAFKENGIFDKETAQAFRENVLQQGGTDAPMKLYKQFRGQEPTTDALLKRRGLN